MGERCGTCSLCFGHVLIRSHKAVASLVSVYQRRVLLSGDTPCLLKKTFWNCMRSAVCFRLILRLGKLFRLLLRTGATQCTFARRICRGLFLNRFVLRMTKFSSGRRLSFRSLTTILAGNCRFFLKAFGACQSPMAGRRSRLSIFSPELAASMSQWRLSEGTVCLHLSGIATPRPHIGPILE